MKKWSDHWNIVDTDKPRSKRDLRFERWTGSFTILSTDQFLTKHNDEYL